MRGPRRGGNSGDDEDFSLSDMVDDALTGSHGNMREHFVRDSWNDAANIWSGHDIRSDDDDDGYPYVHLPSAHPDIHGRYPVNGVYLDIYHRGRPVETLHIDKEDRSNPSAVMGRFADWVHEELPTRDPRDW